MNVDISQLSDSEKLHLFARLFTEFDNDGRGRAILETLEKGIRRTEPDPRPEVQFLDIRAALEEKPPRLSWIIPDLLLKGSVNLLVGAGGRGKSTLTLFLAAEVATGLIGGFFSGEKAQKVLLVNAEDPAEIIQYRLYSYIRPQFEQLIDILTSNLCIWPACGDLGSLCRYDAHKNLEITENFARLVKVIKNERPKLVILDPLSRLLGVDEIKNEAVGFLFSQLERVAHEFDLSWLVIHHPSKWARDSRADVAGRGGSALADNARGVWIITFPDPAEQDVLFGDGLKLRLDFVKLSYGPPRPPVLFRFAPGEGIEWKELNQDRNSLAILFKLLEGKESGLTAYEVWRKGFRSKEKQEVERLLKKAIQTGLVEEVPNKKGRKTIRYRLKATF